LLDYFDSGKFSEFCLFIKIFFMISSIISPISVIAFVYVKELGLFFVVSTVCNNFADD